MTKKGNMTYKPLDKLIENSGYRLDYIANKLGVTSNRLWKMRVDPSTISIVQLEILADLFGCSFFDMYEFQKKFRFEFDKNTNQKQTA